MCFEMTDRRETMEAVVTNQKWPKLILRASADFIWQLKIFKVQFKAYDSPKAEKNKVGP